MKSEPGRPITMSPGSGFGFFATDALRSPGFSSAPRAATESPVAASPAPAAAALLRNARRSRPVLSASGRSAGAAGFCCRWSSFIESSWDARGSRGLGQQVDVLRRARRLDRAYVRVHVHEILIARVLRRIAWHGLTGMAHLMDEGFERRFGGRDLRTAAAV